VFNFTPVLRANYRVGVPLNGYWREVLNSDAARYGGTNEGNMGGVDAVPIPLHSRLYSLTLTLPPLSMLLLQREPPPEEPEEKAEKLEAEPPAESEAPQEPEDHDPDETQFEI
jgi:1,4-alpha-glucan branching enzyme